MQLSRAPPPGHRQRRIDAESTDEQAQRVRGGGADLRYGIAEQLSHRLVHACGLGGLPCRGVVFPQLGEGEAEPPPQERVGRGKLVAAVDVQVEAETCVLPLA